MNSSQILNCEEQVLLTQLPEVAWRLLLRSLGADFRTLESCSEASNVFRSLMFGNGQVSVGKDRILPSVFLEWIDRSDTSQSEPMLLFLSLVELKPRVTVFEIFVDRDFRPEDKVLNSFLQLQRESLEVFHISCVDLETDPVVLNLSEMNRVRQLEIMRSVKRVTERQIPKSLYCNILDYKSLLPALEKLSLSLGDQEDWADLFAPAYEDLESDFGFRSKSVKHLRFVDFARTEKTEMLAIDVWFCEVEAGLTMHAAMEAFPNLVSLEIPAMPLESISFMCIYKLKRLTLSLPRFDRDIHVFDMCITGYGKQVCRALFADPTRDPVQVREEIEETNLWLSRIAPHLYSIEADRIRLDIDRREKGLRVLNITLFLSVEVLRIKSSVQSGPTIVSCADFLNMKSLKILDIRGEKQIHIPDEMIQKMRERFIVLCD